MEVLYLMCFIIYVVLLVNLFVILRFIDILYIILIVIIRWVFSCFVFDWFFGKFLMSFNFIFVESLVWDNIFVLVLISVFEVVKFLSRFELKVLINLFLMKRWGVCFGYLG